MLFKMTHYFRTFLRLIREGNFSDVFRGIRFFTYRVSAKAKNRLHYKGAGLTNLNIAITERCTLRCENCANLMQYFINAQDVDLSCIIKDIDMIFSKVIFIQEVNVLGGEPFLHKQICDVLLHIHKFKKQYGILRLSTNATILPNTDIISVLKDTCVFVYISKYGTLSAKSNELIDILRYNKIPYFAWQPSWNACQQLVDGTVRTTSQVEELSKQCKSRCHTLLRGRLYRCPVLAHGDTLNAYPYNESNFLDIYTPSTINETIKRYLNSITPGCAVCSGGYKGMPSVPTAVQAKQPVGYRVYEQNVSIT